MTARVVALTGARGFVGSAVSWALEEAGHTVIPVRSPRLVADTDDPAALVTAASTSEQVLVIADLLRRADVLVNAAGDPDASSTLTEELLGANALLPRILLEAAAAAGVPRMVHVSSAVVQNDRPVLDDSEDMRAFSAYSRSKVSGEIVLRQDPPAGVVVVRYRPPSVHASDRRVTRRVARIAASPLASVASPGSQPTPQALLPNVASAIAFLATTGTTPPSVVIHPWEGLSAAALMEALGDRPPHRIPRALARAVVGAGRAVGWLSPVVAANVRRVELLWLGQRQAASWLTGQGWTPPVGTEGWDQLVPASGSPATRGMP